MPKWVDLPQQHNVWVFSKAVQQHQHECCNNTNVALATTPTWILQQHHCTPQPPLREKILAATTEAVQQHQRNFLFHECKWVQGPTPSCVKILKDEQKFVQKCSVLSSNNNNNDDNNKTLHRNNSITLEKSQLFCTSGCANLTAWVWLCSQRGISTDASCGFLEFCLQRKCSFDKNDQKRQHKFRSQETLSSGFF